MSSIISSFSAPQLDQTISFSSIDQPVLSQEENKYLNSLLKNVNAEEWQYAFIATLLSSFSQEERDCALIESVCIFLSFTDKNKAKEFLQQQLHKPFKERKSYLISLKTLSENKENSLLKTQRILFAFLALDVKLQNDLLASVSLKNGSSDRTASLINALYFSNEAHIPHAFSTQPSPVLTWEDLKQGPVSMNLVQFIARYFGNENSTNLSVASQWLHHYARKVFADSALFFRELIANAFDAQLPWEKQIGNFGVGFYSIFSQFYQNEDLVASIIITTCYEVDGEKKAYRMTFTKDENALIQVEWMLLPSLAESGTTICLKPKSDCFSQNYLIKLKQILSQFRYFKHGQIFIGENETIGNKKAKIGVAVSLDPSSITLTDKGCGIDLSKIQQLLIPGISSKRRPAQEATNIETPTAKVHPSNEKTSSFIFTANSIVNSSFPLERTFTDGKGACDLVIDLSKAFKPTLSRDGIIIRSRNSPEAKALKKMIKEVVIDTFTHTNAPSSRLLMLFLGLSKWEQTRLSSELKGFFTSYLSSVLKKEFSARPDCYPCQDIQSVIDLKNHLFDKQSQSFIPLPQELILEGYTGFELAVVKRYRETLSKDLPHYELFMKASNKEMIQGLSVLFVEDHFTEGKVSCGPFSSLLLVPRSILEKAQTMSDLQNRICWRFGDDGKQIQALRGDFYQNTFPSLISIPHMAIQTNSIFSTLNTPLFQTYVENVDKLLESSFIQSLDKNMSEGIFWSYYNDLPRLIKCPCEQQKKILFFSIWENNYNIGVDDLSRLKQAIIIRDDLDEMKAYRLKPGADISNKIKEPAYLPDIMETTDSFEEVSENELYKRLVILLLIYGGLDPLKEETLVYVEDGEQNPIDQYFLEIYIDSFLEKFGSKKHFDFLSPLLVGNGGDVSQSFDPAFKISKFYPLFTNLNFFMPAKEERNLLGELIELLLFQETAPSHCAPYLEQILELYYQHLSIPSREFPSTPGKTNITVVLEPAYFLVPQAVRLLQSLQPSLAKKLLRTLTENSKAILCTKKRADSLKKNYLDIPLLTGKNALYLSIQLHRNHDKNIPLLNHILSVADTYEEITALLVIVTHAQNYIPRFFDTPLDYQKKSLALLFEQVIRLADLSSISSWIKRGYEKGKMPSLAVLKAGIDCIRLFTERYQDFANIDPALFQNPDELFNQKGVSLFYFPQWMEAFLNNPNGKEILTNNNAEDLSTLIQNTPSTERFVHFGMLTHLSAAGNGYEGWKKPVFELLKNTQEALSESQNVSSTEFRVNFKTEPYDATKSIFVYEISDSIGFKNLQSLMSLLMPGYHPTDSTKLGAGFFRMLTDVELFSCTTRLQEEPNTIITLIVKPLRDDSDNIQDLKIGLKVHQSISQEEVQGSLSKIYLRKQSHIECLMREKEAKYFIADELLNPMHLIGPNKQKLSYVINGIKQVEPDFINYIDNREMNPLSKVQGGFICKKNSDSSFLLIDGIPQPITLKRFLIAQGLLNASFQQENLGIEGISFSKECFEPSYNVSSFILKPEVYQDIQQFLLNMFYLRLFYKDQFQFTYLDHYANSSPAIDQLIVAPESEMKNLEEMLERVNHNWFYHNYCMKFTVQTQNGSYRQIQIPAFSRFLNLAYRNVYQKWLKDKESGTDSSLNGEMTQWKNQQINMCKNRFSPFFTNHLTSLIGFVEGWYSYKFHAIEYYALKKDIIKKETKVARISLEKEFAQNPRLKEAKEIVEQTLQYYAEEVLRLTLDEDKKSNLSSKPLTLSLFYSKLDKDEDGYDIEGDYDRLNSEIRINLKYFPLSKLIGLLEDLNAHYKEGLLDNNSPLDAGTLNHEIYHAKLHLSGKEDQGHATSDDGASFENQARQMAAEARQKDVLVTLKGKIETLLQEKGWTVDTLQKLAKEASAIESQQMASFK